MNLLNSCFPCLFKSTVVKDTADDYFDDLNESLTNPLLTSMEFKTTGDLYQTCNVFSSNDSMNDSKIIWAGKINKNGHLIPNLDDKNISGNNIKTGADLMAYARSSKMLVANVGDKLFLVKIS